MFALGAVCTHDLAAFRRYEPLSGGWDRGREGPLHPARASPRRRSAVFDFQSDLYLSAPGLPLVLCSGGAVILYFPTDYNPRERERERYFTAVGSLITRDYTRDLPPHF